MLSMGLGRIAKTITTFLMTWVQIHYAIITESSIIFVR